MISPGGDTMLINEICKKCSLTKKAVEYYIEQGLVVPTMQENGYRTFSGEDAERLIKISILRNYIRHHRHTVWKNHSGSLAG